MNLYSIFSGVVIYIIYMFGQSSGVLGLEGKQIDNFTYGLTSVICCVVIHHIQIGMHTRNWTWPALVVFFVSLSGVVIIIWLNDNIVKSNIYKSSFEVLLASPVVWLIILLSVFVVSVPFYIEKQVS